MQASPTSTPQTEERAGFERQPFLDTHRAVAVCAREFTRLTDEVVKGVKAMEHLGVEEKPVIRLQPDRAIIQMGPVALTVAWLHSGQTSLAAGELMVIVWHGVVAPKHERIPERAAPRATTTPAVALWEEVFTPEAADEASWVWNATKSNAPATPSAELAQRSVERLHRAFLEHQS